jgi:hypothetical protein
MREYRPSAAVEETAEEARLKRLRMREMQVSLMQDFAAAADNGERNRRTDKVSANVNPKPEYTGGSVSYYRVEIASPTSKDVHPYMAECNDIIEALQMNYAEGNAFKAIWRMCAARLGKSKQGYKDGKYDAEKVVFFGERLVAQHTEAK